MTTMTDEEQSTVVVFVDGKKETNRNAKLDRPCEIARFLPTSSKPPKIGTFFRAS
jgi:hypothetical protein